jgi:hypothetical protein
MDDLTQDWTVEVGFIGSFHQVKWHKFRSVGFHKNYVSQGLLGSKFVEIVCISLSDMAILVILIYE